MPNCFVIQPFDEKYQKRYNDVYKEAIRNADVEPYKVDEDPNVSVPIESIEKEIANADMCFTDISEDNPNVWFELGYAIAAQKGLCIICAKQNRDKLPFDVQHRNVLFYDSESPSDFISLGKKITDRIRALKRQGEIISPILNNDTENGDLEELDQSEITVLGLIAAEQIEPDGYAPIYNLKNAVSRTGYTDVVFPIAYRKLLNMEYLKSTEEQEELERVRACRLTDIGWSFLLNNKHKFALKQSQPQSYDDIPF